MSANPAAVAWIAAILRKHLTGEGAEQVVQRVAAEIGAALDPSVQTARGRHARLGGEGRPGELPDRIFALLMDGAPRTVDEICGVVATDGISRKQVYNGLGYLIRRREIERLGHARYRARSEASGPAGATA